MIENRLKIIYKMPFLAGAICRWSPHLWTAPTPNPGVSRPPRSQTPIPPTHIHNSPLKGIGVRDFYRNFYRGFFCYACFCPFLIFFDSFLIFDFFLQGKIVRFVRRCFGRLDGSIRALRKVRFRNETRKVFPNPGGRRRRRRRRKNFPRASKPHPPCTQGYHIP